MRAALLTAPQQPFSIVDTLPDPEVEPGWALVHVQFAGICGGDLHRHSGDISVDPLPSVIGHQAAGEVVAVGSADDRGLLGTRCVVAPLLPCEECSRCRTGEDNLCRNVRWALTSHGFHGAFGDRLPVPVGAVLPMPEGLTFERSIPMIDAFATAWTALRRGNVQLGDRALISGVGDVGSALLQLLKISGIAVTVVDISDRRLSYAMELGAENAVSADDLGSQGTNLPWGDDGFDAAFEVAGKPDSIMTCLDALRPGGTCVLVGASPEPLENLPLAPFQDYGFSITRGLTFTAAWAIRRRDIQQLMMLNSRGILNAGFGAEVFDLVDIDEAFRQKRAGECLRALLRV